jgi:hypothetical protein
MEYFLEQTYGVIAVKYHIQRIWANFNTKSLSLIQPDFLKVYQQLCNTVIKYGNWRESSKYSTHSRHAQGATYVVILYVDVSVGFLCLQHWVRLTATV